MTGKDHPLESYQAEDRVEPCAHIQRGRILDVIRHCGVLGITCESLCNFTGINANSTRPRLIELERDGWIERVPGGRTYHGNKCKLYRSKG